MEKEKIIQIFRTPNSDRDYSTLIVLTNRGNLYKRIEAEKWFKVNLPKFD